VDAAVAAARTAARIAIHVAARIAARARRRRQPSIGAIACRCRPLIAPRRSS